MFTIRVLKFDSEGNFLEEFPQTDDYVLQENEISMPIDTILEFFKPKLVNGEVVEGLTKEEIKAIKNAPIPKSEMEILKEENERLKVSIYEMTTYAASQDEQITRQNQAILKLTTLIAGGDA